MIEGRRVLPSDRKPCVLEYNRGGIATRSCRAVVVFAVITSVISLAAVGVKVSDKFTSRTCCDPPELVCREDFSRLETALDAFDVDIGRYPTSKEGLAALLQAPPSTELHWHSYIKPRDVRDPWGRPYLYYPCVKPPHEGYRLVSRGADGIEGTADDVTSND